MQQNHVYVCKTYITIMVCAFQVRIKLPLYSMGCVLRYRGTEGILPNYRYPKNKINQGSYCEVFIFDISSNNNLDSAAKSTGTTALAVILCLFSFMYSCCATLIRKSWGTQIASFNFCWNRFSSPSCRENWVFKTSDFECQKFILFFFHRTQLGYQISNQLHMN